MARLEYFSCKTGCVPHCFQHKRGQILFLFFFSETLSRKFLMIRLLVSVAYCIPGMVPGIRLKPCGQRVGSVKHLHWVRGQCRPANEKHLLVILRFLFFICWSNARSLFIKNWKTSAVSTTDWMVETQLCKLRDTSDTFVGRACHFLYPVPSYPPNVSNNVLVAHSTYTSNEYFLTLTAAILNGCPLLRMRRGAGCWQPKRRLQLATTPPAATDY